MIKWRLVAPVAPVAPVGDAVPVIVAIAVMPIPTIGNAVTIMVVATVVVVEVVIVAFAADVPLKPIHRPFQVHELIAVETAAAEIPLQPLNLAQLVTKLTLFASRDAVATLNLAFSTGLATVKIAKIAITTPRLGGGGSCGGQRDQGRRGH